VANSCCDIHTKEKRAPTSQLHTLIRCPFCGVETIPILIDNSNFKFTQIRRKQLEIKDAFLHTTHLLSVVSAACKSTAIAQSLANREYDFF
jgi:hypothetical protein